MDHQIAKWPIKKVFTSTSGNVHNKTEEDTSDLKLVQNNIFYKLRDKNYRAMKDSLIEITNILKRKITIEKLTHLIIKGK